MHRAQAIEVEVADDHTIVVSLPPDIPAGTRVRVIVEAVEATERPAVLSARERLARLGRLSRAHRLPAGTEIPSDEDIRAAGLRATGGRSVEALLDEIRGEW